LVARIDGGRDGPYGTTADKPGRQKGISMTRIDKQRPVLSAAAKRSAGAVWPPASLTSA